MKKWSKLLIAVLLVVCVISPMFTTANCEINPIYDPSGVDNTYLAEDMNENWLLNLLAGFVFNVAGWAEDIIGNLFAVITGTVDFPWADRIVFNSVAVLDVNFISPADGSYMLMAREFIQNIYGTLFAIALALFGVLVLITAIKLAISTIASDKAKYKQALTSWVLGFVMLWTIHFLMAFLFYLNEQLVIEASRIATNSFDAANDALTVQANDALKNAKAQVTGNFTNYITGDPITTDRFEYLYKKYEDAYIYLYTTTMNNGTYNAGLRQFLGLDYKFRDFYPYGKGPEVPGTGQYVGLTGECIEISKTVSEKLVIQRLTAILDCLESNYKDYDAYIFDINTSLERAFYVQKKGGADNFFNSAQFEVYVKAPTTFLINNIINCVDFYDTGYVKDTKNLSGEGYVIRNDKDIKEYPILKEGTPDILARYSVRHNFSDVNLYFVKDADGYKEIERDLIKIKLGDDSYSFIQFINYAIVNEDNYKAVNFKGKTDIIATVNTRTGLPGSISQEKNDQIIKLEGVLGSNATNATPTRMIFSAVAASEKAEWKDISVACLLADLREIIEIVEGKNDGVDTRVSYVTNLALYFKTFARKSTVSSTGSIVKTDPVISNQIMYAILVVQSIMLFISYLKRLFFVLLLSMMAPFVVVVDFFQKFGK